MLNEINLLPEEIFVAQSSMNKNVENVEQFKNLNSQKIVNPTDLIIYLPSQNMTILHTSHCRSSKGERESSGGVEQL